MRIMKETTSPRLAPFVRSWSIVADRMWSRSDIEKYWHSEGIFLGQEHPDDPEAKATSINICHGSRGVWAFLRGKCNWIVVCKYEVPVEILKDRLSLQTEREGR